MGDSKKEKSDKQSAKETVVLSHTETKKQDIGDLSSEALLLKQKEMEASATLSSLELLILNSFTKKRMMLVRIAIVVNEGRLAMNQEKIPMESIKSILDILIKKNYLKHETVEYDGAKNDVYILTEKGEQEVL